MVRVYVIHVTYLACEATKLRNKGSHGPKCAASTIPKYVSSLSALSKGPNPAKSELSSQPNYNSFLVPRNKFKK